MGISRTLALFATAALLVACETDDATDTGAADPSTAAEDASSDEATAPSSAASDAATEATSGEADTDSSGSSAAGAGCDAALSDLPAEVPNGAERTTEAAGDLDGDGAADALTTWQITLGPDEVLQHLRVATGSGYVAEAELTEASTTANVRPLGTVPIGDGEMAALVVEDVGASAEIVSLWGFHDYDQEPCSLGRLTIGDDTAPLGYPVGGTAGSATGLRCIEVEGTPALAATTVTPDRDSDEFAWESTVMQWSGAGAMQLVDTRSGTASMDDIGDYTGISCPDVNLG